MCLRLWFSNESSGLEMEFDAVEVTSGYESMPSKPFAPEIVPPTSLSWRPSYLGYAGRRHLLFGACLGFRVTLF